MKTGVLLFNLGGPEKLADVRPFLYKLFSDPEIIRVKFTPLRKTIAWTIATLRHKKSEGYYRQIGGGSPLRRLTEEQAASLKAELQKRGHDVETFVGMCTWHPFFSETLQRIEKVQLDRLVILPLFPQFSVTTTGSGFAALQELLAKRPNIQKMDVRWVRSWQDQPTYVEAFAKLIEHELAGFPEPGKTHLLFSAHSIPESYVKNGDPYLDQTKQSIERIMDRLGRQNSYQLSFQSKIGPVKWLEPSTNDVIIDLGKRAIRDVLVIPISFVSEHIETLYELDILYKHVAEEAEVTNFRRVPALNSDPVFIRALAEIVEASLREAHLL
jgi:protoporphyrin/coproporphyrin ferrochelatase